MIQLDSEAIIDRIREYMDIYGLNSAQFSEMSKISTASLSQILNKKTRPTLDVINRIIKNIPEIDAEWFLFGKQLDLKIKDRLEQKENRSESSSFVNKKKISKIVVFFEDGSYEEYYHSPIS